MKKGKYKTVENNNN
ncbi:Hypothetical protein EIN_125910, partial [Entamoeba invadens IP1]